jgi:uncharacterized repeat protein (TIGR04076 family)
MTKIIITVVKTEFYPEFASDVDEAKEPDFGKCPIFTVGQTFCVDEAGSCPPDFCGWAWADIQRDVTVLLFDGVPQPPMKNHNLMYSCCCEGIRPVVFKLERKKEEDKLCL